METETTSKGANIFPLNNLGLNSTFEILHINLEIVWDMSDEFPVCQGRQQSFADCAGRIVEFCTRSIQNEKKFDLLPRSWLSKFDALKKYEHTFSNIYGIINYIYIYIYIFLSVFEFFTLIINSYAPIIRTLSQWMYCCLLLTELNCRLCEKIIVERIVNVVIRWVKIMFSWIEKWFCECCLICNCARTIL